MLAGLHQSASIVGWGSPLHSWLALVNWIGCARCLNRCYRYGARGMHYHILLRQYNVLVRETPLGPISQPRISRCTSSPNNWEKMPHSWLVGVTYWVSFLSSKSELILTFFLPYYVQYWVVYSLIYWKSVVLCIQYTACHQSPSLVSVGVKTIWWFSML